MSTNLICEQCEDVFEYTDAEREFRSQRSLAQPDLCPACRQRDRQRRNGDLVNMYMRTDSFDPFLVGENTQASNTYRNTRGARTMYNATCAACGERTKVPFAPRGDRPVYCRNCYNARKGR